MKCRPSHLLICLVALISIASCVEPNNTSAVNYTHFDIKSFLKAEAIEVEKANYSFQKTVFLNGKEELKEFEEIDFEMETENFLLSDIDKPSFFGRYAIDTIEREKIVTVTFKALDEDLKTRLVMVDYKAGVPQQIKIENTTKGIVYNSSQELTYHKGKGFNTRTIVDPRLEEEKDFGKGVTYITR